PIVRDAAGHPYPLELPRWLDRCRPGGTRLTPALEVRHSSLRGRLPPGPVPATAWHAESRSLRRAASALARVLRTERSFPTGRREAHRTSADRLTRRAGWPPPVSP